MNDSEHNQKAVSGDRSEPSRARLTDRAPEQVPDGESPREVGGRMGPDPVRYGDWEKNGRCIDF